MSKVNNILECFEGFFKFDADCCEENEPSSGLTYEFLEGIDRETIAQIATTKDKNAIAFADRVFKKAFLKLMKRLKAKLSGCGIKFENVIERVNTCEFVSKIAPFANEDRGIRIFKSHKDENPFGVISIKWITLKAENTVAVDIQIRDQFFNIIKTIPAQTLSGQETTVQLLEDNCFPGHDTLYITTNNADVAVFLSDCARSGTCCVSQLNGAQKYLTVDGYDGDQVCPTGFGIVACVEIVCDVSQALCMVKDTIAMALLYQWGVEVLNEAKATNRLNCFTMFSGDWFNETITNWSDEVDACIETDFDIIKSQIKDADKCCIKCCDLLQKIPVTS